MECSICSGPSLFHCDCNNSLICEKCVLPHILIGSVPHEIVNISLMKSYTDEKCDLCKTLVATVNCLCQEEKRKFCKECISNHLEINVTHCVELFENKSSTREIFKYHEKRRKIEYLFYELNKNLEILQEFRQKVSKSKSETLSQLLISEEDAKIQVEKCRNYLNEFYDELQRRIMPSGSEESLAESLIEKVDTENQERMNKHLNFIEAKLETQAIYKSIQNSIKFSIN